MGDTPSTSMGGTPSPCDRVYPITVVLIILPSFDEVTFSPSDKVTSLTLHSITKVII